MEITISVSDKICELAKQNGKEVSEFIEEIIEEVISEKTNGNSAKQHGQNVSQEKPPERRFMRMKGMFSSGKTDTAKRMSELLKEEDFDSKEGFSVK
ncbi:hypothetical protein BH20ACI1_BH20ACI1_22560 [soil metagenome]